jgi:hypothetical protein
MLQFRIFVSTWLNLIPAIRHLLLTSVFFLSSDAQSQRSFRNYAYGDYALLYTLLSCYDWSCVYRESTVGSAVTQLNAAVSEAMALAIPYNYSIRSKYPCWFSSTLKYYISKKYLFSSLQKDQV